MCILAGDDRNLRLCDHLTSTEHGCSHFLHGRLHASNRLVGKLGAATECGISKIIDLRQINCLKGCTTVEGVLVNPCH